MAGTAKKFLERLRGEHPEVQAEYDRLGPRYAVIDALIAARLREQITQSELAARMGVRQPVVARLESGENSPKIDTLAEAAEALGCELVVTFKRRRVRAAVSRARVARRAS
jgi:transcriptional regulator with XRE-family HTH domain